jgi:hypothetical protein
VAALPGHSIFKLEDNGQSLWFLSDIAHVEEIQLQDPSITIDFDIDPNSARGARLAALDKMVKNRELVAFPHFTFPGLGHIRKNDKRFEWVPVRYVNNAVSP